jgi:hypothetical protein
MTSDIISGGNELMNILIILVLAWSLGAVSQDLNLSDQEADENACRMEHIITDEMLKKIEDKLSLKIEDKLQFALEELK